MCITLGRHGRMARSELRNNPRLLPTSWPGLTRPSTLSCATVCGPSWIPGSSPGMTPVGAAPPSQIQISNSHCSPDMRHRPCYLRRGGAVVSCIPAPCERACGTPGARCTPGPDADAVFRKLAHQDFRKARAMARRSACGVLSTCRCLPRRPIKVTLVWPCATGPGEHKLSGRTRFESGRPSLDLRARSIRNQAVPPVPVVS